MTTNNTTARQLIIPPIPINGDTSHAPPGSEPLPQAVEYQVARGRSFSVGGVQFEEGDEVVRGHDVTDEELHELVRARVVLHQPDPAERAQAARFDPTNYTHQNVSARGSLSGRGFIPSGAFCEAADFDAPGRPAAVVEESRVLVHALDLGLKPRGEHTHFEMVRPRREIPAVPETDGAKVLADGVASGRFIEIPEWLRARYREEAAVRASREVARASGANRKAAS